MANAGQIRAGASYVEVGVDENPLSAGLHRVEQRLHAFGAQVSAIGKDMMGFGAAIVAPLFAAGVAFAEMGSKLAQASQRTGVSVEALSNLGFAARQSGVDMDTLEGAVRKMQKAIVGAAGGSKEAQAALQKLGLTVNDLKDLSPDEQFVTIADRLAQIQNPTLRAAEAMAIFGKTGTALLPMINGGAEGINQYVRQAQALGLTIGTDGALAAEKFHQSLSQLKDVMENGLYRIGAAVAPILTEVVNGITNAAVAANRWVTSHEHLIQTALKVAGGIGAAGAAIYAMGIGLNVAAAAAGYASKAVALLLSPVGLLAAGVAVVGAAIAYSTGQGTGFFERLFSGFNLMGQFLDTALGSWQGFTGSVNVLWDEMKFGFQKTWLEIKGFAIGVWDYLEKEFPNVVYGWGSAVAEFAVKVWGIMKELGASIVHIWDAITDRIGDAIAAGKIKSAAEDDVYDKYNGRKITQKDADSLSAAQQQAQRESALRGLNSQVRKDMPGASEKAIQDEIERRFVPLSSAIAANAQKNYQGMVGRKLSSEELQGLVDAEVQKRLAGMAQGIRQRDDARQADFNDKLVDAGAGVKDSTKAIEDWKANGLGKNAVDHMRDAQNDQEANQAALAKLEKEKADKIQKDVEALKNAPTLSAKLKELYQVGVDLFKNGPAGTFDMPKVPNADDVQQGLQGLGGTSAIGSFNAYALRGITGPKTLESLTEKLVRNSEKGNDLLSDIADKDAPAYT